LGKESSLLLLWFVSVVMSCMVAMRMKQNAGRAIEIWGNSGSNKDAWCTVLYLGSL